MKTPDVLLPALRQYQHNDCSGLISGFEHKETCKIVTVLQAKLRELVEAAEWRDECNDLYTEMHIDWLDGKPEAPRMMDSVFEISEEAEDAYQAALKAAKEGIWPKST
jgi:hypothetical protein